MDIEREVRKEFTVFHKQVDAFEYQKQFPKHRSFSFEMPNPFMTQGRRKFFIADLKKFWVWYRNFYSLPRHFYELIQEGLPCRLYFDLEYHKDENPHLEEEKALSDFLKFVCDLVKETYALEITPKSFILLDSTTDSKFSVHAICHFPGNCLFPTNIAMREFIAKLTMRMSETGVGIVNKDDEETFICDPAVYTKNRSFRVLLSSKCGKDVIFKYRKGCEFYDTIPEDDITIFFDSLVVPPDFSNSPLLDGAENKGRVLRRNRATTLGATKPISHYAETSTDFETIDSGYPPSPFPQLDEFVREFNTQFNKNVEIRQWSLLYTKSTGSTRVQYQLNNCKYCLRKQREHISNNVYWTCQIEREWMYQKCFDWSCRDYISNFFNIPSSVIEAIKPQVEKVFPTPMGPKLLPPMKNNGIKRPLKQTKVDDSFNDSARDREFAEFMRKAEEKPPSSEEVRNMILQKKPSAVQQPDGYDSFLSESADARNLAAIEQHKRNLFIDLTEDNDVPCSPPKKKTQLSIAPKKKTPKSANKKEKIRIETKKLVNAPREPISAFFSNKKLKSIPAGTVIDLEDEERRRNTWEFFD